MVDDPSNLAQQTFEEIERELGAGMVPRIFKLLESQPTFLFHLWGQFRVVVLQGYLPRILKEMVGLVVATETHCDYVKTVHLHSLSLQGMDSKSLEAVSRGDYEAKEIGIVARRVLQFAALATTTRTTYGASPQPERDWQILREQSAQALEEANLEEEEKFELIATVALFEQICTVANLLRLDPNEP